ncbi:hypothetical protein ARTHRO9V_160042 [Arthrobacter sp. 9V]|nr:hypothetical protein ARTHRO9V_160042 [Arthrobacter sp. 9V]
MESFADYVSALVVSPAHSAREHQRTKRSQSMQAPVKTLPFETAAVPLVVIRSVDAQHRCS